MKGKQTKITEWKSGARAESARSWVKPSKTFHRGGFHRSGSDVRASKPFRVKGHWRSKD